MCFAWLHANARSRLVDFGLNSVRGSVWNAQRLMVGDLPLFAFDELRVVSELNMHQEIVRMRRGADEFVKLQLQCDLLAALGVLNDEQHYERDGFSYGGESDLPLAGKSHDCQEDEEYDDDQRDGCGRSRARSDVVDPLKDPAYPSWH